MILGLEVLESLRVFFYANSKTTFLINKYSFPFQNSLPEKEVIRKINALVKGPKYIVPATEICKKRLGKEVVSGVYLLSLAVFKKLIPLRPASVLRAISKIFPEKYLELNKKAFNLAKSD